MFENFKKFYNNKKIMNKVLEDYSNNIKQEKNKLISLFLHPIYWIFFGVIFIVTKCIGVYSYFQYKIDMICLRRISKINGVKISFSNKKNISMQQPDILLTKLEDKEYLSLVTKHMLN